MIAWLRTSLIWRTILFANIASVTVFLGALGPLPCGARSTASRRCMTSASGINSTRSVA